MKKITLIFCAILFAGMQAQAQIDKNFTTQFKALLTTSLESIKDVNDEKAVDKQHTFLSKLTLTGFKITLHQMRMYEDNYTIKGWSEKNFTVVQMDTLATKLAKLPYKIADSKQFPNILKTINGKQDCERKLLLIDISENVKAKLELLSNNGTLYLTIYRYDYPLTSYLKN